jgi:hypothetical protein
MRKRAERALRRTHITPESHPALVALIDYAAQRPGLDIRNYGTWENYRSEAAWITRQWQTICDLIRDADFHGVTDAQVIEASTYTYSGRMSWTGSEWDYCTGQYWPTEYRRAICAILRAVLPRDERTASR